MLVGIGLELNRSGRETMELVFLGTWAVLCETLVVLTIQLVVLIANHMMEAGAHGPEWVCTKSFAGSVFGQLAPSFPYQVGGAYAALSIVHGLWLGSGEKTNLPGRPNDTGDSCVSDATWSALDLRVKFAGLGPGGWVQQVCIRTSEPGRFPGVSEIMLCRIIRRFRMYASPILSLQEHWSRSIPLALIRCIWLFAQSVGHTVEEGDHIICLR